MRRRCSLDPSAALGTRARGPAPSLLFGQPGAAGAYQPGVGRLEAPERAAVGRHHKDLFVVLAAESEVGRREIAARRRYRDKPDDDAARVDLQDATEPRGGDPEIALDVIVEAVGAAGAGKVGGGPDG